MEENLRNLSVTDELTGLYNRRGFAFAAEQELKHAHRTKKSMALLFFDMDKLKSINDTYGHAEGDEALKATAAALRSTFRESDIIGRWGGDEFVVLALDVPAGSISILQRRFEESLARRNASESVHYSISLSVGITRYDPELPISLHDLISMADEGMYEGKTAQATKPLTAHHRWMVRRSIAAKFRQAGTSSACGSLKPCFHFTPVDDVIKSLSIVGPSVLIFQVIRVFPDVQAKQGGSVLPPGGCPDLRWIRQRASLSHPGSAKPSPNRSAPLRL